MKSVLPVSPARLVGSDGGLAAIWLLMVHVYLASSEKFARHAVDSAHSADVISTGQSVATILTVCNYMYTKNIYFLMSDK